MRRSASLFASCRSQATAPSLTPSITSRHAPCGLLATRWAPQQATSLRLTAPSRPLFPQGARLHGFAAATPSMSSSAAAMQPSHENEEGTPPCDLPPSASARPTVPPLSPQAARVESAIDAIFSLLSAARDRGYIGEPVSQLEHALQAASFAQARGCSDAVVLAALCHDVGHLCAAPGARTMGNLGIDDHHGIGAQWVRELGFGEEVPALIEGHVTAKRYLVGKNPAYRNALSEASRLTLEQQGGPLSAEEMRAFEQHPQFRIMLALRSFDDQAKKVDYPTPPLESYRDMMRRYLTARMQ